MMSIHDAAGTNWPDALIAKPVGRLHPAVDAEDPEGRDEGADRHHQRRGEVQPLPHPLHPEQHHAQESGFEEEGGQHLVGHQRADDRSRLVGEDRPVGAELIGHDDARDDAHGKDDGEDLQPVFEQIEIERLAGPQPQPFEHRQIARQPDRKGREDEVEAHREGELDTRQNQRVHLVEHGFQPRLARPLHAARACGKRNRRSGDCI